MSGPEDKLCALPINADGFWYLGVFRVGDFNPDFDSSNEHRHNTCSGKLKSWLGHLVVVDVLRKLNYVHFYVHRS